MILMQIILYSWSTLFLKVQDHSMADSIKLSQIITSGHRFCSNYDILSICHSKKISSYIFRSQTFFFVYACFDIFCQYFRKKLFSVMLATKGLYCIDKKNCSGSENLHGFSHIGYRRSKAYEVLIKNNL